MTETSRVPSTSFEKQALPHLDLIYRLALRMAGDRQTAEDLAQETFLRAFRAYANLKNLENVKSWLCRILTNLYTDRMRKRQRRPRVISDDDVERFSLYQAVWDEDPFPYSDNLHDDFLAQFKDDEVRQALADLPDYYRLPVVLCYISEFSYSELSDIFGVPKGTIMSRLYRGRKLLEKSLWDCAKRHGYIKEDPW